MSEEKALVIGIDEKPEPAKWALLSIQHVFAMFGATVTVPLLTGFPVSVALFASGLGTLIYIFITDRKVPIYLGSSFAYIGAVTLAVEAGGHSASQSGLILVGLVYVLVALLIKLIGKDWIDKLLPPIVIGPMIIIIGLGLASSAISNTELVVGGDWRAMVVALVTFAVAAIISTQAKGFFKIIPFICAVVVGYVVACCLGLVDFSGIVSASWIACPEFMFPFKLGNFETYEFTVGPAALAMLPVAIVTISEHIGDHTVLGKICDKNFLKDPGLDKTLMGDGIATAISGFLGGPANTSYGENTGVIGLTKIGSIYVTMGAACIALVISFCGKFTALIQSIPGCIVGGMGILLYGIIASNGLRILVDEKVDFGDSRNLAIASAMLVIGLGGAAFPLGGSATLSGTALAAIVGVLLNLLLPEHKEK